MPRESRFPAMGGQAHVVVTGGDERLADAARERIADLEGRWSRFRPGSELSRLNGSPEQPVVLSDETFTLVAHAVGAWHATGGRYDPTVLPALRAAGYDRDLALVVGDGPVGTIVVGLDDDVEPVAPGCGQIGLDPSRRTVRLPAGVELDPGGIGKGLAADLVTAELVAAGAAGAMVNLGGDLRVRGTPPDGDTWTVAVEDPLRPDRPPLLVLGIGDGGVATSSRLRRCWTRAGRPRHHIIDPGAGRCVDNDLVAVTALAAESWWAEAVTKSVFVAGLPARAADAPGALVATVDRHGHVDMSPELVRRAA